MENFSSKVLMFGEYGVLYDGMALTIPYERFSGKFSYQSDIMVNKKEAEYSNQGLRNLCNYMLENHTDEKFKLNVQKFKTELDKGLFFESNIPQGFGLGSSGALVAAIFLRYLDKAGDLKDEMKQLTKEKISNLKSALGGLEGYFHGTSSGMDPLSILINEPLLVKADLEITPIDIPAYQENGDNVIFLLNTGMARNTNVMVDRFRERYESDEFKDKLQNELTVFNNEAIDGFLNSDFDKFYDSIKKLSGFQLNEMDFLIPEDYNQVIQDGLNSEDYFIKICGAGGGGYLLGFTQNWDKTKAHLADQDLEVLYKF